MPLKIGSWLCSALHDPQAHQCPAFKQVGVGGLLEDRNQVIHAVNTHTVEEALILTLRV